jgi:hypothetical protein
VGKAELHNLEEKAMLRKSLISIAAVAALGVGGSSFAMAKSFGMSAGHSMPSVGRSMGPTSFSHPMPSSFSHPMPSTMVKGPMASTMVNHPLTSTGNWKTGKNWANWDHRHHHHHRNAFFFGVGFAGPYYDYGYDSCWRIVPTYWGGWQRVWVCGDYPYWGY